MNHLIHLTICKQKYKYYWYSLICYNISCFKISFISSIIDIVSEISLPELIQNWNQTDSGDHWQYHAQWYSTLLGHIVRVQKCFWDLSCSKTDKSSTNYKAAEESCCVHARDVCFKFKIIHFQCHLLASWHHHTSSAMLHGGNHTCRYIHSLWLFSFKWTWPTVMFMFKMQVPLVGNYAAGQSSSFSTNSKPPGGSSPSLSSAI